MIPEILFVAGLCTGGIITWMYLKYNFNRQKEYFYIDPLTGLKNSYYLDKKIKIHFRIGVSFILIDIDDFKRYNSIFGYEKTDELLKLFVYKVISMLPPDATFIRYKFGDEFLIVLNQPFVKATLLAERLKAEIKNHSFFINTTKINIQFSTGVTYFVEGDSKKTIITRLTYLLQADKEIKKQTTSSN